MAEYLEEISKKRKEEEGLAARGDEGDRKRKAEEGMMIGGPSREVVN